jgi:hypothetical protein
MKGGGGTGGTSASHGGASASHSGDAVCIFLPNTASGGGATSLPGTAAGAGSIFLPDASACDASTPPQCSSGRCPHPSSRVQQQLVLRYGACAVEVKVFSSSLVRSSLRYDACAVEVINFSSSKVVSLN